jgi:hypothetical protein
MRGENQKYWLVDWLDEYRIRRHSDITRAIKDDRALQRAADLACAYDATAPTRPGSVLAGRGIDLSDGVSCLTPMCQMKAIAETFARTWHYFDQVVFCDDLGDAIRGGKITRNQLSDALDDQARLLLHIREIGGGELVAFRSKPEPVLPKQFGDALPAIAKKFDQLVSKFAAEAKIEVVDHSNDEETAWVISRHPAIPVVERVAMHAPFFELSPEEDFTEGAAMFLVHWHSTLLAADLAASAKYGLPLVTGVPYHATLIERLRRKSTAADVALELSLPVLHDVPIHDLLRIRADESEHFARFKVALTRTIEARLRDADVGSRAVAGEVLRDELEPAVRAIRERLRASTRAFARKSAYSLTVGAVVAACGAATGVLQLLAGGAVAGFAGAIAAQAKFADERREIQLSDMYFLFRAAKRSPSSDRLRRAKTRGVARSLCGHNVLKRTARIGDANSLSENSSARFASG